MAETVNRNMIGAAANKCMHVIGSEKKRERNAELERTAVSGEEHCVTTLITAAKGTKTCPDTKPLTRRRPNA